MYALYNINKFQCTWWPKRARGVGPVLETPYMQAIQVVHADKNPLLRVEDREVSLCCFLKLSCLMIAFIRLVL